MRCIFCQPIKKILGMTKVVKKDKTAKDEPVKDSSKKAND